MSTPSTNIPSWKQTANPPVSPKKGRHVRDKLETSPNSRAKCQRCGGIIQKGQSRVGIQGNVQTPHGVNVWRPRYYHESCVSEGTKRKLHLDPSPLVNSSYAASATAATTSTSSSADGMNSHQNNLSPAAQKQLKSDLRSLRKNLAKQQNLAPYQIFPNRTLDELIAKLPRNESELMQIYRIKERRSELYGDAILRVINTHLDRSNDQLGSGVQHLRRGGNDGSFNNSGAYGETQQTEVIDLT
jgi:superfamily II DNA helicase RecQ